MKYIWQLPQHILALILTRVTNAKFQNLYNDKRIYYTNKFSGISLGDYIIIHYSLPEKTVKHEYGHSIQSLYLGPLYLFVVGIPSITMNILTRIKILKSKNYYKRWPENWADNLGGVQRFI